MSRGCQAGPLMGQVVKDFLTRWPVRCPHVHHDGERSIAPHGPSGDGGGGGRRAGWQRNAGMRSSVCRQPPLSGRRGGGGCVTRHGAHGIR